MASTRVKVFYVLPALALLAIPAYEAAATGLFSAAPAAKPATTPALRDRPDSFADTVEPLLPAVVNISSTQKAHAATETPDGDNGDDNGQGAPDDNAPNAQPQMPQLPPGSPFEDFFNQFMQKKGMQVEPAVPTASLGSGFIIDADKGYIITNNHVIKDADDVRVTFQDNETVKATIVGHDDKVDIAVLKIPTNKHKLTAVKLGDSDKMRVGDWVVAIGNPFGLGGTVTAGIVSARQRDISAGPYDDFIQTDASINRGNTGGPMFNTNGEVIGINTAIFSPSGGSVGIGFAIPSALAKPVIDQIIQYGHTRRGWLGVRIQNVTPEIAESLGLPQTEGALVASLTPKSPAEVAGIKAGDVILEFNGQKLNAMRQLPRIVAEAPIGTEANVVYWREGKQLTTKVKIGELEKAEKDGLLSTGPRSEAAAGVKVPAVGMTLQTISDASRKTYSIPMEIEGVLVSAVDNLSEAAMKGLAEGDVIVELNQQPVGSPQSVADAIAKAKKDGKNSALLLINRQGDVRFVALKLSGD